LYLGLILSSLLLLLAPEVSGNGRYPRAQQLLEGSGDPARLWLRTTYGILTSADRGKSWGWICEGAIGYSGTFDPGIGVFADGSVAVGLPKGLVRSKDGGCSFEDVPELAGLEIADVSVERGDATRGVVLESTHTGSGSFVTRVHRSTDGGLTWQPLGVPLPGNFRGLTLDLAPSSSDRAYVSGLVTDVTDGGTQTIGTLFASADSGASWTRHDIPGSTAESPPYIAAVHPTDPDTLYVRVNGYAETEASFFPEDVLFVSSDGGKSFVELLKKPSRLLGFALSPAGESVLAGQGNPYDTWKADSQSYGLYLATAPAHAFNRVQEGHIGCLLWSASGVYTCTEQSVTGFELGLAAAPTAEYEGLLTKEQIVPLKCPAGTPTAAECPEAFSSLCVRLGTCEKDAGSLQADAGSVLDAAAEPSARGGCAQAGAANGQHAPWLVLALSPLLRAARARGLRRFAAPRCRP
jgi:hypothetical protein